MKETRAKFIPPPTPKEDMKEIVLYIRRLNVILPGFLDQLQKMIGEITVTPVDIHAGSELSEPVETLEKQYARTDSAGIV